VKTETAQHTPGPWRDEMGAFGIQILAYDPEGETIRLADMPADETDDETQANARLIAAAPELLEALRLIARSDGFKDGTWVGELQEIARKAIAKAEGR
jgi:hypothetical protein